MHWLASMAGGSALVAVALFVTSSVHAWEPEPVAHGACGTSPEDVAANSVQAEDFEGVDTTVPTLFYRVDYSDLEAPTIIAVMGYFNDLQIRQGITIFRILDSNGSFGSVARPRIDPVAQGGADIVAVHSEQADGPDIWERARDSGLMPGEYIFQIYIGSVEQTASGPQFATSPSGYLGEFRCAVQD